MKIRVRDQKLPISNKTVKFRPLRRKYDILKFVFFGSVFLNFALIYLILTT